MLDDMVTSVAEFESLLASEVARIAQDDLLALYHQLRVPTRVELRPWEYGSPGQTFPCWIALEHQKSNTVFCYCDQGFGPQYPWGLLFLREHLTMGMDSQWYVSLEQALRESPAWTGANPPGYEVL